MPISKWHPPTIAIQMDGLIPLAQMNLKSVALNILILISHIAVLLNICQRAFQVIIPTGLQFEIVR